MEKTGETSSEASIKSTVLAKVYDDTLQCRMLKEIEATNRHSFTLESNGYQLVFFENDSVPDSRAYCERFEIMSYDKTLDYAFLGIGKAGKNNCTSFMDGMEQELERLVKEKKYLNEQIEKTKLKVEAVSAFIDALPKLMLEDGYGCDKN